MDNESPRSDYIRHESVYATNPNATGWNDLDVDAKVLAFVDEIARASQIAPPARILELGCGMGNLAIPLARAGFEMMGIDISPTAIAAAAQRALSEKVNATFRVGNVVSADVYSDLGVFEAILDGLCWHCIIGRDRDAFLALIRKALAPHGCFLVMTMCGDPRGPQMKARFDPVSRYTTDGRVADRYLGQPADLERELREASFAIEYQRVIAGSDETGAQDMFLAVARVGEPGRNVQVPA